MGDKHRDKKKKCCRSLFGSCFAPPTAVSQFASAGPEPRLDGHREDRRYLHANSHPERLEITLRSRLLLTDSFDGLIRLRWVS